MAVLQGTRFESVTRPVGRYWWLPFYRLAYQEEPSLRVGVLEKVVSSVRDQVNDLEPVAVERQIDAIERRS